MPCGLQVLCVAVLATACEGGYSPPAAAPQAQPGVLSVDATRDALFEAAVLTVVGAGYPIAFTDRARGLITTNRQAVRLSPVEADCGQLSGEALVADRRTTTEVRLRIRVSDGQLRIQATIDGTIAEGKLRKTSLTCVSTGELERALLDRIVERAS